MSKATRPITVVQDGEPVGSIVIADRLVERPVRFAAEELQRYLRLMSGANLPLRRRALGAAIVLSTQHRTHGTQQEDAYSLRSQDRRLHLTGASPRAVLYGAYALLERLGCGFCVPGEETVPRRRTIALASLDVTEVPAFAVRSQVDHPFQAIYPVEWNLALIDWLAKNRLNWYHPAPNAWGKPALWYERRAAIVEALAKRGLHLQVGGHTIHTWLPPARYFDRHPGWYALLEGAGTLLPGQYHRLRQAPAACISHPDVRRAVIRNICRFLDRCPEVEVVDLWDADVQGYCHCPRCVRGVQVCAVNGWRQRGPRTGGYAQSFDEEILRTAYAVSYVEFLNAVAQGVRKRHPRAVLGGLVYTLNGVQAPQWCPRLEDNVVLAIAHILRDSYIPLAGEPKSEVNLRFLSVDLSWRQKTDRVVIYEYYHAWTASGIYPQVNVIAEDLRLLHGLGFRAVETDQAGWSPLNIYAAARLLWNPDQSWEELVRDFCRRYYGEAATAMERYWLALEHGMRGLTGYIRGKGAGGQAARRRSCLRELSQVLDGSRSPEVRRRIQRELIPWRQFGSRQHMRFALPECFQPHERA